MQIDTAGTYTLKYTAEDSCGNVTEVTREVEAVQITYRTVLYTDGTFIINEKSTDIDANVAEHGTATDIYDPFDPNGNNYIFSMDSSRPWHRKASSVKRVEIGTPIAPTKTRYWFTDFSDCAEYDFANLNTSNVTDMFWMFANCWNVTQLDMLGIDTSNVTDMTDMFYNCQKLENITNMNFDVRRVTTMAQMFYRCQELKVLDLSSFNTASLTDASSMFNDCNKLTTIYASPSFVTSQITNDYNMFNSNYVLKGGAGTAFDVFGSSDMKTKVYARIDNPPDAPGFFTARAA